MSIDNIEVYREQPVEVDNSKSKELVDKVAGLLGDNYKMSLGKIVHHGDTNGDYDTVTSTVDFYKRGLLGSGKKLLGGERILRLCGPIEETLIAYPIIPHKFDTLSQPVPPETPNGTPALLIKDRQKLPLEFSGYIVNQGFNLPEEVRQSLESSGIQLRDAKPYKEGYFPEVKSK